MRTAMGILCYARPVHTALTLAFAYANKAPGTDLNFFYGIPEDGEHKSPALLSMLSQLTDEGHGELHYLPDDAERNTGGNVDNLMSTLHSLSGYDCYFKVDDDVIIGPGTDIELATILQSEELQKDNVFMLAAQAVREHMVGPNAFNWDKQLGKKRHNQQTRTIVSRKNGMSPMETYTAVSYKMLPHLEANGFSTSCDNPPGTFGPYSKRLYASGAKAALVLFPHIVMQHIGLTCTTGDNAQGAARSWAPAKCWSPAGRVIKVPHFDFSTWEHSHRNGSQKEVALGMLESLHKVKPCGPMDIIIEALKAYIPGEDDVPLPIGRTTENTPRARRIRRRRRRARVNAGGR